MALYDQNLFNNYSRFPTGRLVQIQQLTFEQIVQQTTSTLEDTGDNRRHKSELKSQQRVFLPLLKTSCSFYRSVAVTLALVDFKNAAAV